MRSNCYTTAVLEYLRSTIPSLALTFAILDEVMNDPRIAKKYLVTIEDEISERHFLKNYETIFESLISKIHLLFLLL